MNFRLFGEKLFEVILLLIGLSFFNIALYALTPSMDLGEWMIPFVTNSYWIGNSIFGFIIYRLTGQNRKISISVGLLATMLPVFGGLFCLLTLTAKTSNK
jgi:hypothetical protein